MDAGANLLDDWPAELPEPVSLEPLGGGWVGSTRLATLTDGRRVVVKDCPYPAAGEADGLAALRTAGVPTPDVLAASGTRLVLEYLEGTPDWAAMGTAIARMHRCTGPRYGWHQDNRAGRFPQPNAWSDDWPSFFAEHRVRTHLDDPSVPRELARRLRRACDGAVQARLPSRPVPSLTHGDLWTGNTVAGRWVIDPEVSFTDRELDLVHMLGPSRNPFPAEFWEAYEHEWPIPDDLDERRLALGLHHRLLGVRHFGDRSVPALIADLDALGW
ncbi:MAG: fructosamine kinase family protein [Micropruina sp.]